MIEPVVINANETAQLCGYSSASGPFYAFAKQIGLRTLRRGAYNRRQVIAKLDEAVGLVVKSPKESRTTADDALAYWEAGQGES